MRIAVTADLHLTSEKANAERFETFNLLLQLVIQNHVSQLILAGDTFDSLSADTAEFDRICSKSEYQQVNISVLPGNHDPILKRQYFTASNIRIIEKPVFIQDDLSDMTVLCLPYQPNMTMGQALADIDENLPPNHWILIGHGDWADGLKSYNESEPGVYMPLTRTDLDVYRPLKVILGHIHKPFDSERVTYPGSPCPLHINETGPRRMLFLDTETGDVHSQSLDAVRIYFNEMITLIPGPDEWKRLEQQFDQLVNRWKQQIPDSQYVRIRLRFQGFTSDKSQLAMLVDKTFKEFKYYQDEGPDFQDVFVADDPKLSSLSEEAIKAVLEQPFKADVYDPDSRAIIYHALKTIYGE